MRITGDPDLLDLPAQTRGQSPLDATSSVHEDHWREVLRSIGIETAELVQANLHDTRSRVYQCSGLIYKIYLDIGPHWKGKQPGFLASEYAIVHRCVGIVGIPKPVRHERREKFVFAVYEAVGGTRLRMRRLGPRRFLSVCIQLACLLIRLSWRGIAHNDIGHKNVLLSPSGKCYLIDFDMAEQTSRLRAAFKNFLRDRLHQDKTFYDLIWRLLSVELGWESKLYRAWVKQGRHNLADGALVMAARCACRAMMMHPLRSEPWRLLVRAVVKGFAGRVDRCPTRRY